MPHAKAVSTPVYSSAEQALTQLNALLPLAARQAALAPGLRKLHQQILDGLVHKTRPAQLASLAAALGEPAAILQQLADLDLIVLNPAGEIIGAYPITLQHTPHHVYADSVDIYAMCAVDALAISPMCQRDCMIRSRCAQTDAVILINHAGEHADVLGECADLHVGIHWRNTGGCAATTLCTEMVFLCSASAAADWQQAAANERSVLTLNHAIELAKTFFLPLVST